MILAAGMGTRLRPLTNSIPKALVPIQNKPALEWIIYRLKRVGVDSIIVNTHYLQDQIAEFIQQYAYTHSLPSLKISHEPTILGTGGGLLKTKDFWDDQPFILHNVDIFSTADLAMAYQDHQNKNALATLLVQDRQEQTKLLIDEENFVCGIHYYRNQHSRIVRSPCGQLRKLGFCGIHVINPEIFPYINETGEFSIIDTYLRLAHDHKAVRCFDIGNAYWKDIGTLEKLNELERDWQILADLSNLHYEL